jgi:DNA-binding NarL/FixJ family response regulator
MTSDLRNLTAAPPARVLIVDDHAIVRYGMGVLLSEANDLSLCGEAGTIEEALAAIRDLKPDIAVIDLSLRDENGLDLIRRIRAAEDGDQKSEIRGQRSEIKDPTSDIRPLPILVLSMHDESTHAEKALRAGAQGYIMKEDADEVLIEALRTVRDGKLYVSENINEKMLRTYVEGDNGEENGGIDSLTDREKEIFACMGQGLTTRKIAEQFSLSPRTVEVHRAKIKKKLECEDAAQLLRTAVQWVENQ